MGTPARRGKYERFTAPRQPDRYAHRVQNACYGLPAELISRICQVDVATARRWKSGKSRIPYSAKVLLLRDLGAFSKYWEGWLINGQDIVSPDGWTINRNHALSVPLLEAQVKSLEQKMAKMRAEHDRIKEALFKQLRKYKTWEHKDEQPSPPEVLPAIKA